MNIFYLNNNPQICAIEHVDKHCIKMILEYSQLLSTAHRVLDGVESIEKKYVLGSIPARWRTNRVWKLDSYLERVLYKATHINHPSAVWVRKSYENYEWLYNLLVNLCEEYTYRYGKVHKIERDGLLEHLFVKPKNIPLGVGFTEPTPAMPDIYKVDGDSIQSYKNYYLGEKTRMFSWKNRNQPIWIS